MHLSYRKAGWAAIISGSVGLLTICSLAGYLFLRSPSPDLGTLMSRLYNVAAIVQLLLMIPVVMWLDKLLKQNATGNGHGLSGLGVTALCLTILSLLAIFAGIVSDIFFMVPQGMIGAWLVMINRRLQGSFPRAFRWFGMLVGFGLLMVAVFPVGFAIFIDTDPLEIPAAPPTEYPETTANYILHMFLWIGSITGVMLLPLWMLLAGRRLLRQLQL